MDAITVALAGPDTGHVAVPTERRHFRQRDAFLLAVIVEETELDLVGDFGEQRKVGARAVPAGAERKGLTWPDAHQGMDLIAGRLGRNVMCRRGAACRRATTRHKCTNV